MKDFFASMDTSQQLYWYIAIGASFVFIIQTIMTFIGVHGDTGDIDTDLGNGADAADHPFQLFSLRNLVNFLLGFGWTGATLYPSVENKIVLGIYSFLVGAILIGIFFLVMKSLMKLAEDNTFKIENTIGEIADVYMTIPPACTGKGKIFISVRGSTHELQAITKNEESIKNGSLVKVIAVEGDILIVEPINK